MRLIEMYDNSTPLAAPPKADAFMAYQGATPHPWDAADIASQPARFCFPMYSYWAGRDGTEDGKAFEQWLDEQGVPAEAWVGVDMETSVDKPYLLAFDAQVLNPIAVYGSTGTLFANPELAGWFPADWTGWPHLYAHPGVMATQYAAAQLGQTQGDFDLSAVVAGIELWEVHPDGATGATYTTVTVVAWTPERTAWNSTLSGIADHYGITVSELAKLNKITNPNMVYPGEKIRVPVR